MKFKPLIILLIFLVFGCSNDNSSSQKTTVNVQSEDESEKSIVRDENSENKPFVCSFNLSVWEDQFPYKSKITYFNTDSIDHFVEIVWKENNPSKMVFPPIIGRLKQDIECIQNLEEWDLEINDGTNFLYSIQSKSNHIGITCIGGNDGWVNEIKYLSFNLKGEKLGEVVLAASGGDGGFYTRGEGYFVNDSTYQYENSEYEQLSELGKEVKLGVTKMTYIIHKNGRIDVLKS